MAAERPILKDPNEHPTDELIQARIGRREGLWISFFDMLRRDHPDVSTEWRFYRDGNQWLMKATRKWKMVFWLSVCRNCFQTTFYLSDKAEELVSKAALPSDLKEEFLQGKRYGKIRGLTIVFRTKKDIDHARSLIAIRLKA